MIKPKYNVLPSNGIQIRKKGFFKFNELYKDMKAWFDEHRYDFHEKEHTEKDKGHYKEMRIIWEGEREFDDYTKFFLKVEFFVEGLKKIDGRETGNIKMTFWAHIVLDYRKKWQTTAISKFLMYLYNNYIIKGDIVGPYEAKLKADAYALHDMAKEHLE
ncbi:MAG: hypothetical protein PHD81_04840 [Candidatus Nanoarchaeia archaeon]|nr:hypothetical protein [Candidatus Nanoarchaeia archaeon]MDD5588404.1 hypothetical protein [Candidatus Nanoarchaeia archaeon]